MSYTMQPRESTAITVFCDYREENWPSMDLAAEMLVEHLRQLPSVAVRAIVPEYRRRLQNLPAVGKRVTALNADRLLNRILDYPKIAGREAKSNHADCYHVVDHSYAHLVNQLTPERTGVYCHDLDTFRCLINPGVERRSWWFKRMTRRILDGLQQAALVFHSTDAVRQEIVRHGIVDPQRLVKAPYGHSSEFCANVSPADESVTPPVPYLLHVGSCIARKRIDVLLDVFSRLACEFPKLALVQVGGTWQPDHCARLERMAANRIEQRRGISREELAALYRRASVVLQPSEAEGFGLPVIEALACGAAVVASDISPLREVGGDAAIYCRVGDVDQWTAAVASLVIDTACRTLQQRRLDQAARFTWSAHAQTILQAYRSLEGTA